MPTDLTCNPHGIPRNVTLKCTVDSPSDNFTLRWLFRSESESSTTPPALPICKRNVVIILEKHVVFQGYFRLKTLLVIQNFTSSDNGVYGCQIGENDYFLSPSPFGHTWFDNSSEVNCSSDNIVFHNIEEAPICMAGISKPATTLVATSNSTSSVHYAFQGSATTAVSLTVEGFRLGYIGIGLLAFVLTLFSASLSLAVTVHCNLAKRKSKCKIIANQTL